jgi:hypothetical protein
VYRGVEAVLKLIPALVRRIAARYEIDVADSKVFSAWLSQLTKDVPFNRLPSAAVCGHSFSWLSTR